MSQYKDKKHHRQSKAEVLKIVETRVETFPAQALCAMSLKNPKNLNTATYLRLATDISHVPFETKIVCCMFLLYRYYYSYLTVYNLGLKMGSANISNGFGGTL